MLPTSALSEAPIITMFRIFDRPPLDVVAIPNPLSRIPGSAISLRQGQIFKCVSFERTGQMKYTLVHANQCIKSLSVQAW